MIALGSATRYAIAKAQNDARGRRYFSNAILCAVLASIPWMLAGVFAPGALLRLMGGDAGIVALGIPYARIFLLFTPFLCATTSFRPLSATTATPPLPWWRP